MRQKAWESLRVRVEDGVFFFLVEALEAVWASTKALASLEVPGSRELESLEQGLE